MTTALFRHRLSLAITLALTTVAFPYQAAAQNQDSTSGSSRPLSLDEVTVTAQRREETLQQTPVSVTAISATELDRQQVMRLDDLKFQVPNIVVEPNTGTSTGAKIFLRGVGTDDSILTADPAVAIYIDDVYIPRQTGAMLDLYDVERIEVLRGPQGTLYGRNATGGAIRYITRQADGEPKFEVKGQVGNLGRADLRVSGGGMLGETVRFSAAAMTRNRDGFMDITNTNTGEVEKRNDQKVNAVRASFYAPLTDFTALSVSIDALKDRSDPAYGSGVIRTPIRDADGNIIRDINDPDNNYYTGVSDIDKSGNDLDQQGIAATLETELERFTWRNIAHYRSMDNLLIGDFDSTALPAFHLYQDQAQNQRGFESQLISNGTGPFTWVGGLYYFNEKNTQLTRQTNFAPPPQNDMAQDMTAYALYAQGVYSFDNGLRLTGGLRYSHEEKDFRVQSTAPDGILNWAYAAKDSWSKPDWKLVLDYRFTDDVMGYASAATGFKSGGYNGRGASLAEMSTVAEETVRSYEIGLKSDLMDNRLRVNLNYYRNEYDDLQVNAFADDGRYVLTNATDTLIHGFEGEITAVLSSNWQVFGGFGTINGKYRNYAESNEEYFAGTALKQAPKLQWTLGTTYIQPLSQGDLVFSAQSKFMDDHYQNLAASEIIKTRAYTLVDARLAYEHGDGRWSLGLWGKNLTDREYFSGGFDIPGLGMANAFMNVPRTYGIDFHFRFL